ncbi:glycosyltransferase [Acinetobacter sp. YH12255]|uniref:glycosyltransferase n=1 Tax=Acinetobacter sp. YH12255 TaxID=2601179 RepID=UPI0015D0E747|nr:glycosyltransferase [Acinetobacter sp. YH12255]
MKILRTQDEIMASWKGDLSKPIVSICCTTYNHEKFITSALRGFLIQETEFPFEIIIQDDASTDETANIIRQYQLKYPKLIKPIYHNENLYSKGFKPLIMAMEKCCGKYIAVCEGDDYWCDENKLSRQVSYLDSNQDIVISSHDAFIVDENNNKIKNSKLPNKFKRDFSGKELMHGNAWLLTMNWMLRNVDIPNIPERKMVKNSDDFLISILGSFGGSHFHTDIQPSAYRIHQGGIWSSLSQDEKLDDKINTYFWIYRYYKRISLIESERIFLKKYTNLVFSKASKISLIYSLIKKLIPYKIKHLISSLRK